MPPMLKIFLTSIYFKTMLNTFFDIAFKTSRCLYSVFKKLQEYVSHFPPALLKCFPPLNKILFPPLTNFVNSPFPPLHTPDLFLSFLTSSLSRPLFSLSSQTTVAFSPLLFVLFLSSSLCSLLILFSLFLLSETLIN